MDRWNSINPLVESVAGRLSRAHLNNELHQLKAAAGNRMQEAVHMHAVTVMARYVGALYGLSISDVLSLSMRDVDGENVEPGTDKREPMRVGADLYERLGEALSLSPDEVQRRVEGRRADDSVMPFGGFDSTGEVER